MEQMNWQKKGRIFNPSETEGWNYEYAQVPWAVEFDDYQRWIFDREFVTTRSKAHGPGALIVDLIAGTFPGPSEPAARFCRRSPRARGRGRHRGCRRIPAPGLGEIARALVRRTRLFIAPELRERHSHAVVRRRIILALDRRCGRAPHRQPVIALPKRRVSRVDQLLRTRFSRHLGLRRPRRATAHCRA